MAFWLRIFVIAALATAGVLRPVCQCHCQESQSQEKTGQEKTAKAKIGVLAEQKCTRCKQQPSAPQRNNNSETPCDCQDCSAISGAALVEQKAVVSSNTVLSHLLEDGLFAKGQAMGQQPLSSDSKQQASPFSTAESAPSCPLPILFEQLLL